MNYITINLAEKDYKARLDIKHLLQLEKALGTNPLNVLLNINENKLPKLSDLLLILHYSLQSLEHGISLEDTYSIWENSGKGINDLVSIVVDIYKNAGLIPEDN